LCNASGYSDEDIDKSLKTVERTYKVPLEDVNGKAGLYEVLVASHEGGKDYDSRVEAFSRICQIINGEPESLGELDNDGDGGNSPYSDDKNNNKESVHSGVGLLKNKTVDDDTTRIISFLAPEVKKRITFKTMLDTHEILYFDKSRKYYRFNGDAMIDAEIEKITIEIHAPFSVRSYVKGEVRKSIADSTLVHREEFDADPYTINLENCLLDVISKNQIEHSPDYLTLSKFPIVYDPDAECPRIEKFLGEVIQDSYKLREVLKFWSSVLLKDCRFEKGLMLLGGGANGKSVVIKLFEAGVGREDNCSNLSLHDIEEDRFARARLFGKALNTYADNKSQKLKETGNLKTVISGDTIEGQNKFKPRFSFRNRAKLIISTNNPPETDDKTYAFYRRWTIVMFENTFVASDDPTTPNKADPQLIEKLTTPGELSGWLNLGLKYLPVLLREGGFAQEPIDQVKLEYEKKADHVSRYIQGYCVIDGSRKDFYTSSKTVYRHYLKVCENDNIKPLDENVFGSRLVEHGISHKRKRVKGNSRDREYVYEPLRLQHELQQEQDTITNSNSGLYASSGDTPQQSSGIPDSADQSANVKELLECIHCALPGISRPIFRTNNIRDYQLHYIFRHPEVDFNEVTEEQ
jgi:putative DNA primase/helicase